MKCFYYLSPTLASTEQISEDLHTVGIKDFYIHVVSKDESGLRQHHIHSSNYLETLDVIRVGLIGAFVGFTAGLVGVEMLRYFEPFGPGVPNMVYAAIVFVATMFGAWEGGLIGIGAENKKLERFHDDLEAGRYLILIYARREQDEKVRAMMEQKHTEAELVAADRYFLNPFARITRPSAAGQPGAKALQKG
ncbi:MAG TPA: hypothetical protein VMT92_05820 [Steroidobacteraceae bacterium]|nr:hypothetical protein [Steroidobacteraceae bacterium]